MARPQKHDRKVVSTLTWIKALSASPIGQEILKSAIKLIAADVRKRLAPRAGRKKATQKLYAIQMRDIYGSPDRKTTKRRSAHIKNLVERLKPDLGERAPLPLTGLNGARYAYKYLSSEKIDDVLENIAHGLLISFCEAQSLESTFSIHQLPNSYRRSARPTGGTSENLAGLMSSLLYELGLSGNVCGTLASVVADWKKGALSGKNK